MNQIYLAIKLALAATSADVQEAVNSINDQFGTNYKNITDEISPAAAAAIVAGAPVAQVAAVATSAVQLDAAGLPWDDRIHSSSKALNTDGTWRGKRGVTPQQKGKVEAQLRNTLATTTTAPAAAATVAALPAMPAPPALALPPIPGVTANPAFTAFVQFVVANMAPAGRITDDWLKASLTNYGVADGNIQNLAHVPEKIPAIEAAFRQALGV